jgi:hypothetical protein
VHRRGRGHLLSAAARQPGAQCCLPSCRSARLAHKSLSCCHVLLAPCHLCAL